MMSKRFGTALALTLLIALSAAAQHGMPGVMPMPAPAAGVSGIVTTVSGSLITILNGTVTIDAAGAVFVNRKGTATIADVKPGVRISALLRNPEAPPGTILQATNVMILDWPSGSLNGPVQSVDVPGSALTIFGVRVQVTASTRIYSVRGEGASTLADIKPGDSVAIEVNVNGSALVAETIQVMPPVPNASLEGIVKSIGPTSWVITTRSGDVTIAINTQTRIDPSVKVGDAVHVIGSADAAGNITAIAIYANAPRPLPPPTALQLMGTVKSIGATTWVITTGDGKDVTITVTADTKIDPTVKVGDSVIVIGRQEASGNFVAVAILKGAMRGRTARG